MTRLRAPRFGGQVRRLLFAALLWLALVEQAWAAAVVAGVSLANTSALSVYTTGSFTPAANDLLFVFFKVTGTAQAPTVTTSTSIAFTQVAASGTVEYAFVANSLATNVSMTVSVDVTGAAGTGIALSVLRVSGMTNTGSAAVVQFDIDTGLAAATPTVTFASSVTTSNPTVVALNNSTNPAGMTAPTNWTERHDIGFNTPATGLETASRDSGFTGTGVTWGSNSASAWTAIGVELDASAPAGGAPSLLPLLGVGERPANDNRARWREAG